MYFSIWIKSVRSHITAYTVCFDLFFMTTTLQCIYIWLRFGVPFTIAATNFEAREMCRTFEFVNFNSQMSSFYVTLAEQILINLEHMERESQSLLTFAGFACICFVTQITV